MSPTAQTIALLRAEIEKIRHRAESEMNILQQSIEYLERPELGQAEPIGAGETATGETRGESITALTRAHIAGLAGAVFDAPKLKEALTASHPDLAKRIKTGVYSSINALLGKGEIERCPDGFRAKIKAS